MAKEKSSNMENSVNVALQGLMGMEDTRQNDEEERQKAKEEAERKAREEAELIAREEAAQKRRQEEQARLDVERKAKEEKERMIREEEERKLKIKLEAEATARAEEQKRLLNYEVEVRRLDAEKRQIPKWVYVVAAIVIFGGGGTGFYLHQDSEAEKLAERRAATAREVQLRQEFAQKEKALQIALNQAKAEEEKQKKRLKEALAAGDAAAVTKAKEQLETARNNTRHVRNGERRKPNKPPVKKPGESTELGLDPIQDFKVDL